MYYANLYEQITRHCATCRNLPRCLPGIMEHGIGRHEFMYEYICAGYLPVLARPHVIVPHDVYPTLRRTDE